MVMSSSVAGPAKVRVGIGSVPLSADAPGAEFDEFVDACERSAVDSLWLPDLVSAHGPDATIGMAWAVARTRRLKVGTGVVVLPGRNPALLASQLATLAVLARAGSCPPSASAPPAPASGSSTRSSATGRRCSRKRSSCCAACSPSRR